MAAIKRFEEVEAWQKARELASLIYSISNQNQFSQDFALKNQIRRASLSIMSLIADGFNRSNSSDFSHCLGMTKGAAAEVKSLLYVAMDQQYIPPEVFERIFNLVSDVEKLASGMLKYLRSKP